eukprot:TRINITY_DN11033_c0_g1_i1.p1 TRINITY_DN11033_c0_g1~~TRINITY_DN11033_c0_g1_i1.p1  ORF type:complete len:477 (+),score=116.29 TRINITY_DN11033_c0_g1_i1:148-1578(+)
MALLPENLLLTTDSYKVTHHKQYPPNTTQVLSYFESRGGKFTETVFFGLQAIVKKWLVGVVVTQEKIDEADALYKVHFGQQIFNKEGWEYILREHGGKLPIRIKAVAEGSVIPVKNVLFTVENTDPKCFWLVSYLETLLVQVWYPLTVASNSYEHKKIIKAYLDKTSDSSEGLPFKLHDFGFRGVSSVETAGLGGAAHLVNFSGTDTVAGLVLARRYYGCDMAGFSIPASEHSTMTSWGQDHEVDAMRNMLEQFPTGLVACVSDSYNIWEACSKLWGGELKDMVVARGERNSTLVVRPDSGDPATVVVKCLELLGEAFGTSTNTKGYKMLPSYIRVIQGDGISLESLEHILKAMAVKGWAADNLAFGSGGSLLQKLNRDTQKCAYKCSAIEVDGELRGVFKDPITDKGKKSKKGVLSLEKTAEGYVTTTEGQGDPEKDLLVPIFENGVLLVDQTFEEIRARAQLPNLDYIDVPKPE